MGSVCESAAEETEINCSADLYSRIPQPDGSAAQMFPPIPVFLKPSAVKSSHSSPIARTAAALIESHVRRASAGGVFICLRALLQACVGGSALIYFSV